MRWPVALLLVICATVSADEAKRLDRYGDALPPGASTRLGTLRFRHASNTTALAFSSDGKSIASGGDDKTVRIWEATTGKELARIELGAVAGALQFGPGNESIHAHGEGNVRIVDLGTRATGGSTAVPPKETKRFGLPSSRGAFSPLGDRVAGADAQGLVTLSELPSGKVLYDIRGDAASDALAWSPDGKRLALGGRDNAIRIWDVEERKETRILGHEGWVTALSWSPDGKTLYSGSADRSVRAWQGGKQSRRLDGHKNFVELLACSPDGKLVASWSRDGLLKLWDVSTGKERFSRHVLATALAFPPEGHLLAVTTGEAVSFINIELNREHQPAPGHEALVTCVTFAADGRHVVSGSMDETIRVWDVGGQRETKRIDAHMNGVCALAFSHDGKQLVSGGRDMAVRVWDTTIWAQVAVFEGHTDAVTGVAFSPDSKLVASLGDNTIRIWDVATAKISRPAIGIGGEAGPLVWSPDGKLLACATADYAVRVFDPTTGKESFKLDKQTRLLALAFSPDSKTLAAGGEGPVLQLWDMAGATHSKKEIAVSDPFLACVTFSSDGKKLAVGRTDGPVRVIDVESGKETKALDAAGSGAFALAWSPDGRQVAWSAADGTVLVGDAR